MKKSFTVFNYFLTFFQLIVVIAGYIISFVLDKTSMLGEPSIIITIFIEFVLLLITLVPNLKLHNKKILTVLSITYFITTLVPIILTVISFISPSTWKDYDFLIFTTHFSFYYGGKIVSALLWISEISFFAVCVYYYKLKTKDKNIII